MRVLLLDGMRHQQLASGYGQLAAGIKQELERRGSEIIHDANRSADVALYVCPPYGVLDRDFDFPVAIFTMHELEQLPESKQDWPAKLNRTNLVLTPTSWNRAVWKALGVTARIEVVPLGVDHHQFYPGPGTGCRVLTVHSGLGSASSRENWRDTLVAFHRAFTSRDPVELVIKTWSWNEAGYAAALDDVRSEVGVESAQAPAITVLSEQLDGPAMRELYLSARIFLKNANREGWGLPATEAVACGVRVAASEIQPLKSHLPPGTRWFALGDVSELAYLLKDEFRSQQADLALAHKYTWQNTGAWVHRHLSLLLEAA